MLATRRVDILSTKVMLWDQQMNSPTNTSIWKMKLKQLNLGFLRDRDLEFIFNVSPILM